MCEWLSRGEWCDVKLLCGGRTFNAHRAVLASVSTFMRHTFLSCPADETPTSIVLPDFDLEAVSSVLYYVYNGEVILQKHKLRLFLDIIQALQIHIDGQYLSKISETGAEGRFDFSACCDENTLKSDIFTLGFENDKNQRVINIRRGTEVQSMLVQYSQGEPDFNDNIIRCKNGSELHMSGLGDIKSPYGGRQRNSFLRDLFIETYPQNGNVNGPTEGVLAISNEYYRPPASELSTNANGQHLSGDSVPTRFCTKTSQQTLNVSAVFHSGQRLQCTNSYNEHCKMHASSIASLPCIKCSTTSDMAFIYGNTETASEFPNDRIPLLAPDASSLGFQQSFLEAVKYRLLKYSSVAQSSSLRCDSEERRKELKSIQTPKVIFNQVLENPWNPRKPNNFRPSRRKVDNPNTENLKVEKAVVMNDTNNNIEPALEETCVEKLTERITLEVIRPSSPVSIGIDSFKCTHCNQVFTSGESLAVHMRKHSTNARYTCGECGKTFSQLRNFKYHMSIHRGTREFAATCTVCGKYFNDRGYLSSHMKIHRNRKEYKCSLCPKSFNQRVAYNMHVRIHTGVKPHVCEECGKAFSRKMLLKQHQRTHSGERPYACPHCDKRFADRSNMTLHLRLHTGVKPFSCSLCPKSFTKKHHLKSHLNFHTGSKPYSCPRCKLAFTQSSNMRTHYKKCSAPAPGSINESQGIFDRPDSSIGSSPAF